MNEYERDIFYDVDSLTFDQRKTLLKEAYKIAKNFRVDILDCSVSWARQKIDMSFKEIMKKYDTKCHTVVIYRRGFFKEEYIGEIAFTTMTGVSYYLWIYVTKENLDKIIKEYKLCQRQS